MLDNIIVVLAAGVVAFLVPAASAQEGCKKDENGNDVCPQETHATAAAAEASGEAAPKLPSGLPVAAQVAIAVVTVTVVLMCITMFWCIRRSRRASEEASQDVMVEASQVTGPPAILAATYTPETGHSKIYSIGLDTGGMTGAMSGLPVSYTPAPAPSAVGPMTSRAVDSPAMPSAVAPPVTAVNSARPSIFNRFASTSNNTAPVTAPAHKANFTMESYHFTGHGSTSSPMASPMTPGGPRSAFVSNGGFPRPLLAGRLKDRIRERPPSISSLTNTPITSAK